MNEKELELILSNHLKNKARLKELIFKKENYEKILNNNETKEEIISSMQLSSVNIRSIPNTTTNLTYSPTESVVMNYEKKIDEHDLEKQELLLEIVIYNQKIIEEKNKIERVENWLAALNKIEKFIIEQFYMYCNKRWDYVIDAFVDNFRDVRSKEQLKRIKRNALKNILEIINYK